MKVYITDDFRSKAAKLPRSKQIHLDKRIDQIYHGAKKGWTELKEVLDRWKSREWKSKSQIWKIDFEDGYRVFYLYTSDMLEFSEFNESGIMLTEIMDHDSQYKNSDLSPSFYKHHKYEEYNAASSSDTTLEAAIENYKLLSYWPKTFYKNHWSFNKMLSEGLDMANVLLSEEQSQIAKHSLPFILSGSAGSGKTLVALHILKSIIKHSTTEEDDRKYLYLTYTKNLRNEAQKKFKMIHEIDPQNVFYTLESFCFEKGYLKNKAFFTKRQFENWFDKLDLKSKDQFDPLEVWTEIRGLIKGYMGDKWDRDLTGPLIPKGTYLNLKQSPYEEKIRENIYKIALLYQEHLEETNSYDDNDLARIIISNVNDNSRYDYIVVDEIQDFTELQWEMTLRMTRSSYGLFAAGDQNQVINPTFFEERRLQMPFKLSESEALKTERLLKNYRSSKKIIDLANLISAQRKELIGSGKELNEQDELSVAEENNSGEAFILEYSPDNISKIVNAINERATAAIITANENEKNSLKNYITEKNLERIFTINEAKGLEFDYVVCFNMISHNIEEWEKIYSRQGRRSTASRFYFNQLYVSVTRARSNVCFLEEKPSSILDSLSSLTNEIKEYDSVKLGFEGFMFDEDWLLEAVKMEEVEDYDRAILYYSKYSQLAGKNVEKSILRCQGHIHLNNNHLKDAVISFIEAEEYDIIEREIYKGKIEDNVFNCWAAVRSLLLLEHGELEDAFAPETIIQTAGTYFYDDIFIKDLTDLYYAQKIENLNRSCESCREAISEWEV